MRSYLFPVLLILTCTAYAQTPKNYFITVDYGKDTLTISLTEKELAQSKESRVAELGHLTKHRKKKLQEDSDCEIKLYQNDTTFWAWMIDFYDGYFIGLIGTLRPESKNKSIIHPIGYRRIKFEEIEWITTDGKKGNILAQELVSALLMGVGSGLTILSLKDDPAKPDPFSPGFFPVGIGLTYLGVRMFDDTLTKTYSMKLWKIEARKK